MRLFAVGPFSNNQAMLVTLHWWNKEVLRSLRMTFISLWHWSDRMWDAPSRQYAIYSKYLFVCLRSLYYPTANTDCGMPPAASRQYPFSLPMFRTVHEYNGIHVFLSVLSCMIHTADRLLDTTRRYPFWSVLYTLHWWSRVYPLTWISYLLAFFLARITGIIVRFYF